MYLVTYALVHVAVVVLGRSVVTVSVAAAYLLTFVGYVLYKGGAGGIGG